MLDYLILEKIYDLLTTKEKKIKYVNSSYRFHCLSFKIQISNLAMINLETTISVKITNCQNYTQTNEAVQKISWIWMKWNKKEDQLIIILINMFSFQVHTLLAGHIQLF